MAEIGKQKKGINILRKAARIFSIILIIISLIMLFGNIFGEDTAGVEVTNQIEYLMPISMFLSVFSLALAWRWEILAGALNIGLYLINYYLYWLVNDRLFPFGAFLILGIAVIPGIIFLILGFSDKKIPVEKT
jgi:hypothetical protein